MEEKRSGCKVEESAVSTTTYTVDSFANGISFGQHRLESGSDPRDVYELRLEDDKETIRLRSRYALHTENPLHQLELQLMRLSRQGVLGSSQIYLGATTDPFHPFEGRFDASIKFLELFERYTPGMLTVQTRSPLIVIAMPILKRLGKRASVTLGIETCLDEAARRYTPNLPRVDERLKTAAALRRFGVEVAIQVSPVLPYGDWRSDAGKFADILVQHADRIFVKPLVSRQDRGVKTSATAQRLAHDRLFHYLRPDSANPLITEIEKRAPEKLQIPSRPHLADKQLKIFAA